MLFWLLRYDVLILLDPCKRKSTILVNEHLIAAVSFIFVYGTLIFYQILCSFALIELYGDFRNFFVVVINIGLDVSENNL